MVLQCSKNAFEIQLLTALVWLQLFSILGFRLFLALTVFSVVWSAKLVLTLIAVLSVFSRVLSCVMFLKFLLPLVCCSPSVFFLLACLIVLVNCIYCQQEQICAEEASTYAKFQQASKKLEQLYKKMQFFSAKLLYL